MKLNTNYDTKIINMIDGNRLGCFITKMSY